METSGPKDEVFKLFPPITIDEEGLKKGFDIIEHAVNKLIKIPVTN